MNLVSGRKIVGAALLLLASGTVICSGTSSNNSLSADEIIQRAVKRAGQAESRAGQADYTYKKLTVTEEFDSSGRVKEHKEKVYQVIFQSGATRLKLLTVNGREPAAADLKWQAAHDSDAKQLFGTKSGKAGDNRETVLTPELVARFDFSIVGETSINGRKAYELAFQPKQPTPPRHHIIDRFVDRLSGTIWIDAEEFEVARADIRLGSEVDVLGGVVGSLKKLVYSMTRTRVGEGLWFNTFSTGDFEGRKLLDSMRIKTRSQSSNFRPLG